MIKIRQATEDDISALEELMHKFGCSKAKAKKRASKANSDTRAILVLEDRSELLGYVGLKKQEQDRDVTRYLRGQVDVTTFSRLMWLGVGKDLRTYGYDTKLVHDCERVVTGWEKHGIWVLCKEGKKDFYSANGYKDRGPYNSNHSRIVMAKIVRG